MNSPPRAIPYQGGKSFHGKTGGVGKWIASKLPYTKSYVEPFCGMMGILLQRKVSYCEVVNDKNHRIINWWRCVRDRPDDFARLVELTPRSRAEYVRAMDFLSDHTWDDSKEADLELGLATHIAITQSVMKGDDVFSWGAVYKGWGGLPTPEIAGLASRIRKVQLHNIDAIELMRRISKTPDIVVYCDPPYRTSELKMYKEKNLDVDTMSNIMNTMSDNGSYIAVSGYGDEWDHLGWNRSEFEVTYNGAGRLKSNEEKRSRKKRVEVLWTNYSDSILETDNRSMF